MPDTAQTPFHLVLISTLLGKFFYLHFAGGEIEA